MAKITKFRKNHAYGDDHDYENYFEQGDKSKTNHKQEARKKLRDRYEKPEHVNNDDYDEY